MDMVEDILPPSYQAVSVSDLWYLLDKHTTHLINPADEAWTTCARGRDRSIHGRLGQLPQPIPGPGAGRLQPAAGQGETGTDIAGLNGLVESWKNLKLINFAEFGH